MNPDNWGEFTRRWAQGGRKRNEAKRQAIAADLRNTRLTQAEIATKHDCGVRTVHDVLKEAEIVRQPVARPNRIPRRPIIDDLTGSDLTLEEIAAKHSVSVSTLYNVMREAGINRTPKRAKRNRRIPAAKRQAVIEDLLYSDLRRRKIAERHGISVASVGRIKTQAGVIETGRERQRRQQEVAILEALETDATIADIADRAGVTESRVVGLQQRHRIEKASIGGHHRRTCVMCLVEKHRRHFEGDSETCRDCQVRESLTCASDEIIAERLNRARNFHQSL